MIHMACLQQAGIPKFTKVPDLKSKIQNIQKKLGIPLGFMASYLKNHMRKPSAVSDACQVLDTMHVSSSSWYLLFSTVFSCVCVRNNTRCFNLVGHAHESLWHLSVHVICSMNLFAAWCTLARLSCPYICSSCHFRSSSLVEVFMRTHARTAAHIYRARMYVVKGLVRTAFIN
jgi:hypothetical protein